MPSPLALRHAGTIAREAVFELVVALVEFGAQQIELGFDDVAYQGSHGRREYRQRFAGEALLDEVANRVSFFLVGR